MYTSIDDAFATIMQYMSTATRQCKVNTFLYTVVVVVSSGGTISSSSSRSIVAIVVATSDCNLRLRIQSQDPGLRNL